MTIIKRLFSIYAILLLITVSAQAQFWSPSDSIRFSENRGLDYDPGENAIFYNDFNNGRVVKLGDIGGNGWFLGKLGVGTSQPKETLDVRGAINIYRGSFGKDDFIMSDDDPKIWSSAHTGTNYPFSNIDLGHLILQPRTSSPRDILFITGDGDDIRMSVKGDGNVGVGTTSPKERLDVRGAINIQRGSFGKNAFMMSDDDPKIWSSSNTGSEYPFSGSDLGHLILQPRTSAQRDILFVTGDGDDVSMLVKGNGSVGIGTISPTQMLSVNGTINAEEIILEEVNGADFVFEEDYDLRSLEETEEFIKTNKHLPEIPSAKEMAEEGIELKVMNVLLLQKIEELTLHLIELKKENKRQNEEIEKLKAGH